MKFSIGSFFSCKLLLPAFVLAAGLAFFSSQPVAHAQSDCIDPATGAACTPVPPPSCGVAGMPPCEPPPSQPRPTKTPTPRPLPTRTPTATPVIACDTNYLAATLTGENVVPAVRTEGQGMVKLFLDLSNDTITGNWQVSNLSGLITAAHIHNGPAGVNAGMFIPFNGLPLGGTFSTIDKAPALLLKSVLDNPSAYYVNIHSTAYPGGEIRGQLACASAEPIASPTPTSMPTIAASATSLPEPSPTPKPIFSIKKSPLQPVNYAKHLLPQPDIEIVKIEITQAIQCLENATCPDNSVSLYAGKPTLVRVYVRLAPGAYASVSDIGGRICLGNKGQAGCGVIAAASSSINSINKVTVRKDAHPRSDRTDLNATINFLLPPSWVKDPSVVKTFIMSGKPLEFTVYVNYLQKDYPLEIKYDNNFKEYKFDLYQSIPVALYFVPVASNGTQAAASELWTIVDWVKSAYPTSSFDIALSPTPIFWTTDWLGGCGGWNGLLMKLAVVRGFTPRIWYGMVDKGAASPQTGGVGCGWNPISVSGGFVGYGNRTTAHIAARSFGYTLRRQNAPGCGVANRDPFYPDPDGNIDEAGVDVLRKQLYLSYISYDYMGSCGNENNTWTSRHTYDGLTKYLPAGYGARPGLKLASVNVPQVTQQAMMLGGGIVSPNSLSMVSGFYLLESAQPLPLEEGPYTVELLDQSGYVLHSQSFNPVTNGVDVGLGDGGYFVLSLPWSEDARLIRFKYQDSLIGEVKASRNKPVVELTSTGPEQWPDSGLVTISWTASDKDGDVLTSLLDYSNDGGESWTSIGEGIPGNSMIVDTAYFPGSDQALIRITVTDGFNSSSMASAPFQVGDKSPLVHISWPEEGLQVNKGEPFFVQASGFDQEDGMLDPNSLVWNSDRDGNLGSGDLLIDSLAEGDHTLQLSVKDSAGHESVLQVYITVLPPEPDSESIATLDPTVERTLNYVVYGVVIFALVIVGLLVALIVFSRKSRQQL